MRKKIKYSIFLSLLFLAGCETPIDLHLEGMDTNYYVEGYITTDTSYQYVKVGFTRNYLTNNSFEPVTNADVSIVELENKSILSTISFKYDSITKKYKSVNTAFGIPGRIYQLHIKVSDKEIVGEEIMNRKVYMDSLKFTKREARLGSAKYLLFQIIGYAREPGETTGDAYMWDGEYKGVIFTDTLHYKNFQNDELVNGNYIPGVTVVGDYAFSTLYDNLANTFPFQQGDTFTVYTSKISSNFLSYIWQVLQSTGGTSPFSGPASNPKGNLYLNGELQNGVYGYFATKAVTKMYHVLDTTKIVIIEN